MSEKGLFVDFFTFDGKAFDHACAVWGNRQNHAELLVALQIFEREGAGSVGVEAIEGKSDTGGGLAGLELCRSL